jgi:hypothetical protein
MKDCLPVHQRFDESKRKFADNRYRARFHHAAQAQEKRTRNLNE